MAHRIEKIWEHAGLICVVLMYKDAGHRCGYVGIPWHHPLYEVDYHEETDVLSDWVERVKNGPTGKRGILEIFCASLDGLKPRPSIIFDVHGSLTYSGAGYPLNIGMWSRNNHRNGCQIWYPLWWFGYDCGHDGDALDLNEMPDSYRRHYYRWRSGIIRTLEYCIDECNRLAEQLKEVEK